MAPPSLFWVSTREFCKDRHTPMLTAQLFRVASMQTTHLRRAAGEKLRDVCAVEHDSATGRTTLPFVTTWAGPECHAKGNRSGGKGQEPCNFTQRRDAKRKATKEQSSRTNKLTGR